MAIILIKALTDGLSSRRLTQVTSRRISLKVIDLMSTKLPSSTCLLFKYSQHSHGGIRAVEKIPYFRRRTQIYSMYSSSSSEPASNDFLISYL
jgi:hypothetical protein